MGHRPELNLSDIQMATQVFLVYPYIRLTLKAQRLQNQIPTVPNIQFFYVNPLILSQISILNQR